MFKVSKKIIISGAIGNILEMYDYAIWGLFSVFLSKAFLPESSNLSDVFFIFLFTYIFRPIGGVLFGLLADQLGRKKILTLSIIIMGFCTAAVGLLPSYNHIGLAATLLLLLIRLIQVFSVGGEYISSIALLIESCDKKNRGYYGSWAAFGINVGMMLASIVAAITSYLINNSLIPDWGWRLAFLVSLFTSALGFWIRNTVPESYEFIIKNSKNDKRYLSDILSDAIHSLKTNYAESFIVFSLVCFDVSTTVLLFVFSPIYMSNVNNISTMHAFTFNAVSLALVALLIPFFGSMSDKYGRIKTMFSGIILLSFIIIPYFVCMSSGNFYQVMLFHILIAIPCACIFSITPVLITELFPLEVRCSITGFIYSIAACLGGGLTPILAFKLSNQMYGAFLLGAIILTFGYVCVLGLIALNAKNKRLFNATLGLYQ